MSDFQQTVDLRGKIERSKKAAQAKAITPLEEIYEDEGEIKTKADLKKIYQPKVKEPREGLIKTIVFILAILVIGATVYSLFFRAKGGAVNTKAVSWYAVKQVDGKIYYGQISDTKANPVVISNVYKNYDQIKETDGSKTVNETGNLRLVKSGQETYGPDGTMLIYQSQIMNMEPLKSDSKVLQAILQYEK